MSDDTSRRRLPGALPRRRLLGAGAALLLVAFVFAFALPRIADYRDVWTVLRQLGWGDGLVLTAATCLNLATFPPPWMVALPGLGYRQALAMTQASTALSIVTPAGAAVGMAGSYAMLRSWGFGGSAVGLAVALTGVWNQVAALSFPIVALALLTAAGEGQRALRIAALAGVAVLAAAIALFAAGLASARRARQVGGLAVRLELGVRRVLRRPPTPRSGEELVRFRERALSLLRRRWHALTVATLAGHLTVFVLLLVCLHAMGTSGVTVVEAFAAWSLTRILGLLPLTPGGLGVVELGLTGALVAFGAPSADAVAATLLYRALAVLPTLALGLLAALTWRTHQPGGAA
jgi:uncharacterized protein (TIRG00374 family)